MWPYRDPPQYFSTDFNSGCLAGSKEVVEVMQSAANSVVDAHFSACGTKLWSLAQNGEVMLFDLRQMRPVNVFYDMQGATSLG